MIHPAPGVRESWQWPSRQPAARRESTSAPGTLDGAERSKVTFSPVPTGKFGKAGPPH